MKKNQSIGPIHILLDDRYDNQLKPLRDAVFASIRAKRPRSIVGEISFQKDFDGLVIPFLTVVCPTHSVSKRYVDMAKKILGVRKVGK